MSVRTARDRQHRQIVGVGLAVSLAVHAVVLGAITFHAPDTSGEVGKFGQPEVEAPFETAFLELIDIEEVPEPVEVEPIIDNARAVVATPTPEQQPTPAAGELSQAAPAATAEAASGAGAPAASSVATELVKLGREARIALSMKPQFVTQRSVAGADQPIEALDPHAGHDHAEDDGDEEDSWWRRLGITMGSGGGRICRPPRPPVVIHKLGA